MPTLAVTKHSCPPTKIGSRITSRMRSATRSASRSSATSGSSATNSSPPRRPTASSVRCEREPSGFERALHHLVGVAHAGAQAARHFHQQFVAGGVAERVVDDLEAVQVDQQQRALVAQAARVFERALGAPDQLAAVGQAGQRVEVGQVADLVLGHAAVGHVLHDAGVADAVAVFVELGLGLDVDDALAAVEQRHRHVGGQHRAVRAARSCSRRSSRGGRPRGTMRSRLRRLTRVARRRSRTRAGLRATASAAAAALRRRGASRSCPCAPGPARAPAWPCCAPARCACATRAAGSAAARPAGSTGWP